MRAVFDGLTTEKHSEDGIEVGGERLQRKNDKTRQFLARTASRAGSCHLSRLVLTCFDDSLQGSAGKWIQELREQGDRAVPVITGYLVDEVDNTKSGLYCWLVWTVLRPLT